MREREEEEVRVRNGNTFSTSSTGGGGSTAEHLATRAVGSITVTSFLRRAFMMTMKSGRFYGNNTTTCQNEEWNNSSCPFGVWIIRVPLQLMGNYTH